MSQEYPDPLKKDPLGIKGEEIARNYLLLQDYRILEVNWHWGHKEVDVIAMKEGEIVIVEVKSRLENFAAEPWEAITSAKIRNIVEVADVWLRLNQVDLETRFDVISIVFLKNGSHLLEHFEGAFLPPVN